MRKRARTRVLEYVAQHPGAAAGVIAVALGATSAAIRHHLRILLRDGRIEVMPTRPGPGRGRPRVGFRISRALAGNNLAMLAEQLLAAWQPPRHGRGRLSDVVGALAQRLSDELRSNHAPVSARQRLGQVVERLNQLHYQSHWEAGPDGPRLLFGHCPYEAVIREHPELCRMDTEAVGAVLSANVEQQAKIDPDAREATACVLALRYR